MSPLLCQLSYAAWYVTILPYPVKRGGRRGFHQRSGALLSSCPPALPFVRWTQRRGSLSPSLPGPLTTDVGLRIDLEARRLCDCSGAPLCSHMPARIVVENVDQQGAEPGIGENLQAARGGRDENAQRDQRQHRDGRQDNISRDLFARLAEVVIARDQREEHVSQHETGDLPDRPGSGAGPEDIPQQGYFEDEQGQVEQGMTGIGMTVHQAICGPALCMVMGGLCVARPARWQ